MWIKLCSRKIISWGKVKSESNVWRIGKPYELR
jgi:hypothetical protein